MNPYYYQGGPGVGAPTAAPPPQPYNAPFGYPPPPPSSSSNYYYYYGRGTGPSPAASYGTYQRPPPPSYGMSYPYGAYPPQAPFQQQYPFPRQQQPPPNALPALTFEQGGKEDTKSSKQGIQKYLQLSPNEEQQYAMFFRDASKGSGTVLGRDAVQFFGRAVNVDRATLRKIWDIADYRSAGELRREEFYIALRLLAIAQLGYEVSKKTLKQFIGKELIPELKGYSNEPSHPPIPMNMYPPTSGSSSNMHNSYNAPPQYSSPSVGTAGYPPQQTTQYDFWELKSADCKKIDHQFAEMDKTKKGFLAGTRVAEKLAESGLPRPVLKQIWDLADVTRDGKLDYIEFRIAMALVNGAKQGYPLPPSLPPSLQPEKLKKIPFARKTGKTGQSLSTIETPSRSYNPSSSAIYASYGPGAAPWQENPSDLVRKAREADEELERAKLELSQVEKEYQDLEEETYNLRSQLDSKKWEVGYWRNTLQEQQKGGKTKSVPPPSSSRAPSSSPKLSQPPPPTRQLSSHQAQSSSDIFSEPVPATTTGNNYSSNWNDYSALPPPPSSNTILENAYSSSLNDTDDFLDRPYVPEGTWSASRTAAASGGVSNASNNLMNDWAQYYPSQSGESGRSRGLSSSKKHE